MGLCWLGLIALGDMAAAQPATAQSIGDWNRNDPSVPRIEAAPIVPTAQPISKPAPKPTHAPTHAPTPAPISKATSAAKAPPKPAPAPAIPAIKPAAKAAPVPQPAPPPRALPASIAAKPVPKPVIKPVAKTPAQPAPPSDPYGPWPMALAGLLGAGAGWAMWRRKPSAAREGAQDDGPPARPATPNPGPTPAPAPPAAIAPAATAKTPAARPAPPPIHDGPDLALTFTPTRFSTTLAEAVMRYRLTVTNLGDAPLGPIAIRADMQPAGQEDAPATPFRPAPGFRPDPKFAVEEQDEAEDHMPERHRLMLLHPGESVEMQGQMRLPLHRIAPLRVGAAALFVPVVRVEAEGERPDMEGPPLPPARAQLCLMVGEPAHENAALAPFRIDQGPASADRLASRTVPLPA